MAEYSLTYTGIIIFIVGYLFKSAGVPFVEGDLQTTITFLTTLVGVLTTFYGRYRKGDLTFLGFKKPA